MSPERNTLFGFCRRVVAVLAASLLATAQGAGPDRPQAAREEGNACPPRDGLSYLCGPVGSEDAVQVPGTRWLIASGLNLGAPAHLYLVDTRRRTSSVAYPDAAAPPQPDPTLAADCPRPPDPATLSTDGLALRAGRKGLHRLYAANHGDRQAVEVFDVDARGTHPVLRWVGCVPMPAGILPNAVAPLPEGGLLVISFHDPNDPQAWARMARGEDTGLILEWQPGKGLRELPGSRMSGGNGLAVSADGNEIYASAWSGSRLVVLSRRDGSRREIPLPFLPDNLHRLEDGTLLVGGQRTTAAAVGACRGPHCPQPWVVARVDPASGRTETLLEGPGSERVDYACGALAVDGQLYVTVRGDRRLVVAPLPGHGAMR